MAFITPNFEEIRESILNDLVSLEPNADTAIDSDNYVRASVLASCVSGVYTHQKWVVRQIFPDTADSEYLEMHAGLRQIYRKNATYATGFARLSGANNARIPIGTQMLLGENYYEVTEEGVIRQGLATVAIRSLATGAKQNITRETPATLMSAPTGIASEVVLFDVYGGTNAETDAELLNRLLERIRRPPAGGNKYDYKNWALSVDGVDAAYVYPLRRGLGTVDIAITASNNIPSDETLAKVQAYIDEVRPVTARESKVVKPDITRVNFVIQVKLDGISLSEIQTAILTALQDYFNTLIPGDDLIVSQCEAVVNNLVGVVDRRFSSPTRNLKADVVNKIEWFRLGTVTVSAMTS